MLNGWIRRLRAPTTHSYREELYGSRRLVISAGQNISSALSHFAGIIDRYKLMQEVRRRRQFTKPCEVRHNKIYANRKRKFDAMVRDTMTKVLAIHEEEKRLK